MEPQRQVVTFLMSDIVGSTGLWEQHPGDMRRAVASHDAIASRRVAEHGGRLVKPRGEGDSLFAVFRDPGDAVACAVALQANWTAEPWPGQCALSVRIGIHTGTVEFRDDDYYGRPVNLCARLRSIAHGGQILITRTTRDLIGDSGPAGAAFRDLGTHRLTGLSEPVHVHQVTHPALRAAFPPLRSLDHTPTNLPFPANPMFVGRDDVLDELHSLLSGPGHEPVAIVGITGLGKTQLAIEYAHRFMSAYPGGVFFVNASDTARMHLDCAAIGEFFDLPEHLTTGERAARVRALLQAAPTPVLLIVDNLTDKTERVAIPGGPQCRVLVTSNQRHVVRQGFRMVEPSVLETDAALRLLQSRRRAEDANELEAAAQIASALGGLPLALALVANHVDRLGVTFAQYRSMLSQTPVALLGRARRRFISDTGHDGGIFDAIALRYQSLEDPAPRVLIAASPFAGRGISPDLLFEASGLGPRDDFDEAVADLVDDALLAREQSGRLALHSLVRLLVRELAPPDEVTAARDRAASVLTGHLRAANEAMDWSAARPEISHCYAVAARCRLGPRLSGADEGVRSGPVAGLALLEPLLMEMGAYQFHHGELAEAVASYDEGACVAETLRGPRDLARALFIRRRGEARQRLADGDGALGDARSALALATALLRNDDPQLADYHVTLGYVLRMAGRFDAALPHYEKALAIHEAANGRKHPSTATCLNNLGALREAQGDLQAAQALLDEALAIDSESCDGRSPRIAIRLNNVGRVEGKLGDWNGAYARHLEALAIYEAAYGPSHPDVAGTHYHLGLAAQGRNDHQAARDHLARALAVGRRFFDDDHPFCRLVMDALGAASLPAQGAVPSEPSASPA